MEVKKSLFIGEAIKNKERIIRRLKKKQWTRGIYCICIETKGNTLLEIIDSYEMTKEIYGYKKYILIGIAKGKMEAQQVVLDIIVELYKKDSSLKCWREVLLQQGEEI